MRAAAASGIDFDLPRFESFLHAELPRLRGPLEVERIGGGQSNPTYFVTVGADELVLRKRPAGVLAKSAHDVGREYRIISALTHTGMPVPEVVRYCDDTSILGTSFYLMRRLHGVVCHDSELAEVSVGDRKTLYRAQARTLASLHALDYESLGLGDLARPGSFIDRQITRWTGAWADARVADLSDITAWLLANRPVVEKRALTHGDFKFNNLVVDPDSAEIVGVLDWELAAIGDPLLDVAHMWAATWATTRDEYGGVLGLDLAALGLPTPEDYAEYYGDSAWLDPFYRALALLRYAGIFRGIGERAKTGTATAADASATGKLGEVYLNRVLDVIEGA